MGIRTAELKKIPNVIAVVEGSRRSEAILAAIRGGFINSLVIDELGGRDLLDALTSGRNKP